MVAKDALELVIFFNQEEKQNRISNFKIQQVN